MKHRLASIFLILNFSLVSISIQAREVIGPRIDQGIDRGNFSLEQTAVVDSQDLTLEVRPDGQHFDSLSDAAFFYLGLARQREWRPIPGGPLLRHGDQHPQIAQLRQLLTMYGDLPLEKDVAPLFYDPLTFDSVLKEALIRFQIRHGAKPDGVLGPKTRAVLNISPQQRAYQIALNIERQSSFNGRFQSRYIQVNIPEYRLRYIEDGAEVLAMKTIIGRSTRQTPVLESQIRSLVINPSWNVPKGIAYKDILPRWQEDSEYLEKHNLKVVSGWSEISQEYPAEQVDQSRMYRGKEYLRFVQPPGKDNALGKVKFLFPNQHEVYLHDTPQRSLFKEANRAFSSGCIRLENPMALAKSLMKTSPVMRSARLKKLLDSNTTKQLRLREPVPLYLTYWTAWLDDNQKLHFGEDVYSQDELEASSEYL